MGLSPQLWHHLTVAGMATTMIMEYENGHDLQGIAVICFNQAREAVTLADDHQQRLLIARYHTDNPYVIMRRLVLEAVEHVLSCGNALRQHTNGLSVECRTEGPPKQDYTKQVTQPSGIFESVEQLRRQEVCNRPTMMAGNPQTDDVPPYGDLPEGWIPAR